MLKQTFKYRFEVERTWRHASNTFDCVGGEEGSKAMALLHKRDWEDRRDKRKKKPRSRIVEIITSEWIMEEYDYETKK